jgi:hypothetical protein
MTLMHCASRSSPSFTASSWSLLILTTCSHPGPIVLEHDHSPTCMRSPVRIRGLLYAVQANGDPLFLVPRAQKLGKVSLRWFSMGKEGQIKESEIVHRLYHTSYIASTLAAVHATLPAGTTISAWADKTNDTVLDCVIWALRTLDSSLLGLRGFKTWSSAVLRPDEPVVIDVKCAYLRGPAETDDSDVSDELD